MSEHRSLDRRFWRRLNSPLHLEGAGHAPWDQNRLREGRVTASPGRRRGLSARAILLDDLQPNVPRRIRRHLERRVEGDLPSHLDVALSIDTFSSNLCAKVNVFRNLMPHTNAPH